MSILVGKRRAGRASILAANVQTSPFRAFQGVCVFLALVTVLALSYVALHHRNNALRRQNALLEAENQRCEQQIMGMMSRRSSLTSPNNQFLERLDKKELIRVSSTQKRTISHQALMVWYDKVPWENFDEGKGLLSTLPQMAGSGFPTMGSAVVMGRDNQVFEEGVILE